MPPRRGLVGLWRAGYKDVAPNGAKILPLATIQNQMIRVECTKINSLPHDQKDRWDLRIFPSPVGNYALKFFEPQEFRMGAYGWKLALLKDGMDVSKKYQQFTELTRSSMPGVPCPNLLQPWNKDGSTITIPSWDGCVHLYNVVERKKIASVKCGSAWIILWSPHTNQFLSSTLREHFLVGKNGNNLVKLNLECPNLESPSFFWFVAKPWLGALSRRTANSKPELKIFDGTTGTLQASLELDSEKFVPYAAEQFRHLSRERYSLEVSKGQRSVGWLLDMWRFHSFDTATNSLYLSIYRPAGISKQGFGGEVVPVQEVHVKFNLSFDS